MEADGAKRDADYDAFRDARLREVAVLTLRLSNVEIGSDPQGRVRRIREVERASVAEFHKPNEKSEGF